MDYPTALKQFARQYLEGTLAQAGGVVSKAAKLAGLSRSSMYRILHQHGIRVSPIGRYRNRGQWDRGISEEERARYVPARSLDGRCQPKPYQSKVR